MARRRTYKRDRKGRFARVAAKAVGVNKRPEPSSARRAAVTIGANALIASATVGSSRSANYKGTVTPASRAAVAIHGAKIATTGARQGIKYAKRRTSSKKRQEQLKKADGVVEVIDRAVNIALLGVAVNAIQGIPAAAGRTASRPWQQRQQRLKQQQKLALGR